MDAQTHETESTPRSNRGWIWVVAIVGGLLLLCITCVISTLWGGMLGYALGRRNTHGMMVPGMPYESPYAPEFPFEPMPDMPEMPGFPDLMTRPWLGVTFVMTDEGAHITEVTPGSPADEEGLAPDDIITEVDGRAVTETQRLDELILDYAPGDRVALTVLRDGRETTVRVRLASWMEQEMPWQPEPAPFGEFFPSG